MMTVNAFDITVGFEPSTFEEVWVLWHEQLNSQRLPREARLDGRRLIRGNVQLLSGQYPPFDVCFRAIAIAVHQWMLKHPEGACPPGLYVPRD